MPARAIRSRLHRGPDLAPLILQNRDLAVLLDLFYYRYASTPALFLSARWVGKGAGMQHFAKRLTHLWRAGYVERFTGRQSLYLHGSEPFVYTIGSGKASAAARTGLRPSDISPERWREVLAEAAPARDRVRYALGCVGIAPGEIERVLHNNTELALKHYAGESSGVRHRVLAADFLSRFWFEARMRGDAVEDIQPDGVADLSFREPDLRRYRDLVTSGGVIPIKPDCLFTIAGMRYALEAETGASSTAKLRVKLGRYARLMSQGPHLWLLVHCQQYAHADLARSIVDKIALRVATVTITSADQLTGKMYLPLSGDRTQQSR
jgi:hypothetical protein